MLMLRLRKLAVIIMSNLVLVQMCICLTAHAHRGLIKVPVADLLGAPIKHFYSNISTEQAYLQIPLNKGQTLPYLECPRIHQALFNEVVEIIEEHGHEVHIKLPNAHYYSDGKLHNHFWTLKKNIISFETLKKNNVDMSLIPSPIDNQQKSEKQTAALVTPFTDPKTRLTYSAGTRFVVKQETSAQQTVMVAVLNYEKNQFDYLSIPQESVIIEQEKSIQEKVDLFIKVLKKWSHRENGSIPYVWGGCSFTFATATPFEEKTDRDGRSYMAIENFDYKPKPGFDCSNLILRAAQIAGIPYTYRNSSAIAHYLTPATQSIEEGDIIWIPGHVMVVADLKKNTIIEARGYNNGPGKVQEIELSKTFENIHTFKDLFKAYKEEKKLYRLDKDCNTKTTVNRFKVLKLTSAAPQGTT